MIFCEIISLLCSKFWGIIFLSLQLTNTGDDDHSTDNKKCKPKFSHKCCMLTRFLQPSFNKMPRHSSSTLSKNRPKAVGFFTSAAVLVRPVGLIDPNTFSSGSRLFIRNAAHCDLSFRMIQGSELLFI